ncbi:Sugar phosphate permease [Meinhardsimonia xiamenensis]|jgi:MFS family permease|uniref:Sugar phosphate permease n=1 Tax=Meinhardsimonia xiamenensis TaxID=990712 RepID=A0A1G9EH49_9RHOB|nr:MFS transporter [Meinhardsimonia xiamenensis]PRX33769.1 sugar phosphate permease [Meinhardsimonia xiamenensis]SDK75469.1 Sugar phosphate permease [Meinhardsimonia xiamenensis]
MQARGAIVMLALGETLVWAGIFYIFPALILRWEQAEHWPKEALTGAFTLAVLISAAAAPLAGRLIDAGRGPVMMGLSALLGALAIFALSGVREIWQFYLVWAVAGLAMAGALYEPCFALVTRARGAEARGAITLITLVAGFASSLSFPAAHLLAEAMGWRGAAMVFAAVVAGLGAPLLWAGGAALEAHHRPAPLRRTPQEARTARRKLLSSPLFWMLALGFALAGMAHGATINHLLPILADRGVAATATVVAASFIGPMQVAGRLAMAAVGARVSPRALALGALLLMTMAILNLAVAGRAAAFLIAFVVLFGGAYGTISILRPIIAREVLGGEAFGAKSGALALVYLLGAASAPWLASLVWSLGGYGLVLAALVALLLAGSALLAVCFSLDRSGN